MLAKLVSGLHKPDDQTVLLPPDVLEFVGPLPVRALPGEALVWMQVHDNVKNPFGDCSEHSAQRQELARLHLSLASFVYQYCCFTRQGCAVISTWLCFTLQLKNYRRYSHHIGGLLNYSHHFHHTVCTAARSAWPGPCQKQQAAQGCHSLWVIC